MKIQSSFETLYALIFAACVLLALFLLTACDRDTVAAAPPQPVVQNERIVFPAGSTAVQRLTVEKVTRAPARDLALPGRLVWNEDHTVRVLPPFAGRVTRIIARVGDRVAAGQPLVEILSPDFGQAQADARKANADLALARRSLDRLREMHGLGLAAAKDVQQAEAELARAQAEADRAMGRLRAYGQDPDGEPRFVLKSPMAGIVVERNVNPGQELRPDQSTPPLFVVTDPTRLWVSLDANESDLRFLKPGVALSIASNQLPDAVFTGTLRQIADFVDPVTRTVKLRGDVPNPQRTLKAEMFVTARVHVAQGAEATVDARAVYLSGSRHFVFVREDGAYVRRPVAVGAASDGRIPVREGLREGEEVVTAGNLVLEQLLGNARNAQALADKASPKT